MRISLLFSVFASCLGLAACGIFDGGRSPTIEGCKSQIVSSGAEVDMSGLKWPIAGSKVIEIAGIKYTPKQLQVLTDRVMQMDTYKMSQCSILAVALKSTPPPSFTELQPLLLEVAKLNAQIMDIRAAVNAGKPADTVVKTAEQAAEQLPAKPTPIQTGANGSNFAGSLTPRRTADIAERLDGIEASIKKLSVTKAQLYEQRIVVRGFEPNAVALTTWMRTKLLSDLSDIKADGPGKRVMFDVVGYADNSGAYANNIKLGLERARLVAGVVLLHVHPTPTVRFATSAGVAEVGTDGRRVEVFYTAYSAGGLEGS